MEKVKVINKHEFGAGFNLLSIALAGTIAVDAIIKWKNWRKQQERIELLKTASEAINTCDKWLDKYAAKDEVEKENEES